jgi:eukaryotic-like serine/threonine-protein kinase
VPAAEDTQITQEHEIPGAPPPGPPPAPPGMFADVGPWLALFGLAVLGGLAVWFFVVHDRGNNGKVVPAVVGQPQRQAVSTLTGDGLNVQEIVGPSSRPRGIVVSQKPGAGSRVASGQTVTLHVSNGHSLAAAAPRITNTTTTATAATTTTSTSTTAAETTVPSVTGQDMASAAGQIEAAGFVAETDPVPGSETAGTVTAQDPSASAQAPAGSVIRLSVAMGSSRPPVTVPNVTGQKAAAARATLLNAALTTKTVYKKGPAKSMGVVLAESPTGSQPRYAQVTLTVGS